MKFRLDPLAPNGVSLDNSTIVTSTSSSTSGSSVTVAGEDYLTLVGQEITANAIDLDNLSATGTPSSSTFLRGDNTWATPAGSGDVSKVGTPVNNQVGVWTGDGTLEGDTALTFDTITDTLTTVNIAPSGTVDGRDVATDGTKLDTIETSAEVNNISDANATDLTDAGDTLLHYHSTDRSRANHTGTQTAATISDFDTEVSNNTDVAANTAARHAALTVTDSTEIDFTLTGQDLTASLKAGSIDETKLDLSTNASLDLADSAVQNLADLSVTATAAELNTLDGITATTTELNYTDGVTSSIQTQIDGKPTISSGAGAPASTPTKVGDIYIDTTGDDAYLAVGTVSSADWEKTNDGTGGISDGDKGDITVSGSGATWTIDNGVVTYAKMQDVSATSRILGRITTGAGDTEELTAANVRTIINVEDGADVTDTANVTAAGALMDSEVDADIKTLSLPASTTITAAAATVLDDLTVGDMVNTLGGATSTGTGGLVRATSPALVTPTGIVKGDVGLGNVDNTSDANKPVSTATQTALDAKVTGPASATDNAIARFDSTTGKLIQNSGVTIDDSNNLFTTGYIDANDVSATGGSFSSLVEVAGFGVRTDAINEKTSAAGVTIDGVLLKDSAISIGGVNIPTISSTDTLTNKTIDANGTGNSITNVASLSVKRQNDTTNSTVNGARIETGWGYMAYASNTVSETITFNTAFSTAPIVTVTFGGDSASGTTYGSGGNNVEARVFCKAHTVTTTNFVVQMHKENGTAFASGNGFYQWTAIGS